MTRIDFKFIFLAFFLFALSINAQSQEQEYVITSKGDTLMGKVTNYNFTWVKLRSKPEEKAIKLSSVEVKDFNHDGKTFASVLLPLEKSPQFLQILQNGRIMLYEYFKTTGATLPCTHIFC